MQYRKYRNAVETKSLLVVVADREAIFTRYSLSSIIRLMALSC
ncbi:hypothetical protein [Candidatus Kuenenia stuttgartiensis]|nr:hypothetical protein [Candidatus Kuenenia stuttgartiensis]